MSERIGDFPSETQTNYIPMFVWIITGLIIGGLGAWYVFLREAPTTTHEPEPIVGVQAEPSLAKPEPAPEPIAAEDIPVQAPPLAPQPEPLPALANSDELVRTNFQDLVAADAYRLMWSTDNLVQRWVAIIDAAADGNVMRGVISLPGPSEKFSPIKQGQEYFMAQTSYHRYEPVVDIITALPAQVLVAAYHQLRPLTEESYGQLGKDPAEFDNRLMMAINRVLRAPVYPGAIELKSKSVSYTYAQEDIESLTDLDKLFVRMGPENTAAIQRYARELKAELLKQ